MAGFFGRLFGGGKKKDSAGAGSDVGQLVQSTMEGLIEKGRFDLNFEVTSSEDDKGFPTILIEVSGQDEELLKEREGQMIDSIQLFLQRVVQHNFPEDKTSIQIDCNGYREESSQALIDLADKLKDVAIEKGKSVYIRALPPKDRKIVHQYLASDERVKSRSIGDGLYKKIKIYPAKSSGAEEGRTDS